MRVSSQDQPNMTRLPYMDSKLAILCITLAGGLSPPVAADWIADGDLRYFFNDNVSRALAVGDKKADFGFGATASAGQFLQLTDSTSLAVTGDFKSDLYTQYGGLNQYTLGATAALKQKLGLGAYAPWMSLSGTAHHADFQSAIRDSWFYGAGITVGKRLDEKWDVQLEYSYLRRRADRTPGSWEYDEKLFSGAVFDQTNHGLNLSTIYAYDDQTAFTASYAFRTGDAFSSNASTDTIAEAASAATPDGAFGSNLVAYKLPADTHSFSLLASRAMGSHSSVNLGYRHHWTTASQGLAYHVNVVELSLMHSF